MANDYGYREQTHSLTQLVEKETVRKFGDETLQTLNEYKTNIQAQSYVTTMRLCAAYRVAKGMGLPDYHKKINSAPYINHPDVHVREWAQNMSREYGEVVSSSIQSWLKVIYEGGVQPLSALFGMKSDYIYKRNLSFFELHSWFYSLYTLYLVDSLGFLQASMHCLATLDADVINRFATTVMIVDSEISLLGHALTLWGGAKVIQLIFQALKWTWRPVAKMGSAFLRKVDISPSRFETGLKIAGLFTVVGLGAWSMEQFKTQRETARAGKETIITDDLNRDQSLFERREKLKRHYTLLHETLEYYVSLYTGECSSFGQDTPECENIDTQWIQWVLDKFSEQQIFLMKEDYHYLQNKSLESDVEKIYVDLLDQFLPLVEEVTREINAL